MSLALLINADTGEQKLLDRDTTVGREHGNDIVLKDMSVSRQHAVFSNRGDIWYLTDRNSRNGITVNKAQLAPGKTIMLKGKYYIVLGNSHLIFSTNEEDIRKAYQQIKARNEIPVQREMPVRQAERSPVPEMRETPVSQAESSPAPEVRETPVREAEKPPVPEERETPVSSPAPTVKEIPAEKPKVAAGKKKANTGLIVFLLIALLAGGIAGAYFGTDGFKSKAIRSVQQEIQAIGEVTKASGEQIDLARKDYEALSAEEQAQVKNRDKLAAALIDRQILQLGEITMDSEAEIEEAKAAYNAASPEVKALVLHEQELEAAEDAFFTLAARSIDEQILALEKQDPLNTGKTRELRGRYEASRLPVQKKVKELARLEDMENRQAAAEIDDKIREIGEVSLNSADTIRAARSAYDTAEEAVRKKVTQLQVLTDAEALYRGLSETEKVREIKALYDAGTWEDAEEKALRFLQDGILEENRATVEDLCVKAGLEIARRLRYDGLYASAEKKLEDGVKRKLSADDGRFQQALDSLQSEIKNLRPYSGDVLAGNVKGGYCELTVKNSDRDTLIKIEDILDPDGKYLLFYVRGNEEATVNVQDGTYTLKYASGSTWYGQKELFGSRTSYNKANTFVNFKTEFEGYQVHYKEQVLTLYKVQNGNLTTSTISEDDF